MNAREAAFDALRAEFCVLPPKQDGTKMPDLDKWRDYQHRLATRAEIAAWYRSGRTGVGILCGAISQNAEMLELEGRAVKEGLADEFKQRAAEVGLRDVLTRISKGWCDRTPGGGLHLHYRCPGGVTGSLKLAERPATDEELAEDPAKRKVLIETRGEGGYVVIAPSNGRVHPSGGAYERVSGGPATVATITTGEREALFDLARSFDQMPHVEAPPPHTVAGGGDRPGDDFNRRARWADILQPHGWSYLFTTAGGNQHWRRPGKPYGTSATINENGEGAFYVFTTSTELEANRAYSKFSAYALLEHGGDYEAAARELRRQGYGGEAGEIRHGGAPVTVVAPLPEAEPAMLPEPPSAVFHGLAGSVARLLTEYVESDAGSLLVQGMTTFSTAAGIRPCFMQGPTRHSPAVYTGLIGPSSRGRKGTGGDAIEALYGMIDYTFTNRIETGIGSGEKLVHLVRDPDPERGIEGATDRRLLLRQGEMASLLAVVNRENNTLRAFAQIKWTFSVRKMVDCMYRR